MLHVSLNKKNKITFTLLNYFKSNTVTFCVKTKIWKLIIVITLVNFVKISKFPGALTYTGNYITK